MESVRLDKWLWAARFFKTRSLARAAVEGGKVHIDQARAKPARALRVGDRLEITRGEVRWEVVVEALSERRGPASAAQALYEETTASREQREQDAQRRRDARSATPDAPGRPTKRDRRQLERLKRGE